MSTKGVELFRELQEAEHAHKRAREAYRRAQSDLFYARERLNKAQAEHIEHLKRKGAESEPPAETSPALCDHDWLVVDPDRDDEREAYCTKCRIDRSTASEVATQ